MIDDEMWDSEYLDSLDRDWKLTYIWTFTNAHMNIAGCYKVTKKRMASNLKLENDMELLDTILNDLTADGKIIYRDGWMLNRSVIDHQKINGSQMRIGVLRLLEKIPVWAWNTIAEDNPSLCIPYLDPNDRTSDRAEIVENLVEKVKAKAEEAKKRKSTDTLSIPSEKLDLKGFDSIESDSSSLSQREQEPERVQFGRTSGIKAADLNPADSELSKYVQDVIDGIKSRMGVVMLAKEFDWSASAERSFHNGFSVEHAIEVYELLDSIRVAKGGHWRITAENWEQELPLIESRRKELKELHEDASGQTRKDAAEAARSVGARPARII